jgi:hypothetical protein
MRDDIRLAIHERLVELRDLLDAGAFSDDPALDKRSRDAVARALEGRRQNGDRKTLRRAFRLMRDRINSAHAVLGGLTPPMLGGKYERTRPMMQSYIAPSFSHIRGAHVGQLILDEMITDAKGGVIMLPAGVEVTMLEGVTVHNDTLWSDFSRYAFSERKGFPKVGKGYARAARERGQRHEVPRVQQHDGLPASTNVRRGQGRPGAKRDK